LVCLLTEVTETWLAASMRFPGSPYDIGRQLTCFLHGGHLNERCFTPLSEWTTRRTLASDTSKHLSIVKVLDGG
jgi:hypothetical protein